MPRKAISLSTLVIALTALALPAHASAINDPTLTDKFGHVQKSSLVVGRNVGNAVFWNTAKTVQLQICDKVFLTGKVTSNTGGEVEGELTNATFTGTGPTHLDNNEKECTGDMGSSYVTVKNLPLIVKSTPTMLTHEFQVTGAGAGNVKFLIGSTIAGECEYETLTSIKGDYTTSFETSTNLTIRSTAAGSGSKLIRGGFLCPSSGMLGMTFSLATDISGEPPIWID